MNLRKIALLVLAVHFLFLIVWKVLEWAGVKETSPPLILFIIGITVLIILIIPQSKRSTPTASGG